jgi:hypothetical protein
VLKQIEASGGRNYAGSGPMQELNFELFLQLT